MPALMLVGCGESAPDDSGATSPDGATAASSAAARVDVCALLTDDEAAEVAENAPLVSGSSATYTIEREKQNYGPEVFKPPLGGCKFSFYSETAEYPRSINATVVIEARDGNGFDIYKSGTPVAGLGDEAYESQGSTVVRAGNVMLSAGENSATDDFVVEMYRRMVDNLP